MLRPIPRLVLLRASALTLAAALPWMAGCLSFQSHDPQVPQPEPEDAFVSAQAQSDEDDDTLGVALVSSMPNGHFVASSQVTVIQPDARRDGARFESPKGENSFEQHVAARYARGDAVRERKQGGIPLFYSSEEKRMLSANAFYNEQIRYADANRDGVLTDTEVGAYARAEPRNVRR